MRDQKSVDDVTCCGQQIVTPVQSRDEQLGKKAIVDCVTVLVAAFLPQNFLLGA